MDNGVIAELLRRVARLGGAAWGDLVNLCYEPLRRYVFRLTADATLADDIVEEALLALITQSPTKLNALAAGNPAAWLFSVARRKAIRAIRSRICRSNAEKKWAVENRVSDQILISPSAAIESADEAESVRRIISVLPSHEQAIFRLRYVEGMRVKKIAEELGLPGGTVRSSLFRGLQKLRNARVARASWANLTAPN